MKRLVFAGISLLVLAPGIALAGKCSQEISNLEKERAAAMSKMALASAPDQAKAAKFAEVMMRARKADDGGKEQECLDAVEEARISSR